VVRFDFEELARRNSDRLEQDRWWAQTADCFTSEVSFQDCPEVDAFLGGGADQAGFVQVIQGQAADVERLRAAAGQLDTLLRALRPDVIGGTVAWHGDGASPRPCTSPQKRRPGPVSAARPRRICARSLRSGSA
jgi:hypothetical protein